MPSASLADVFQKATPAIFLEVPDAFLTSEANWKNPPKIPTALGESVESFSGNSPFHIFLIQDAHAIPEAQKAAAKILEFWILNQNLNFVGLEGASGDLPHTILGAFPGKTARSMLAETLLEEAIIGGPEYLQMTNYPALRLRGVEDARLYNLNLEAFLQTLDGRENTSRILENKRAELEEKALKVMPFEYLRLRKKARKAREQGNWKDYLEELQKIRKENRVKEEYPSFDFFMMAEKLAAEVSTDILRAEFKQMKRSGVLDEKLAEQVGFLLHGAEPAVDLTLEVALWKKNSRWLKDYPNAVSALKAAYLMRRAGAGILEEAARMEKEWIKRLCPEKEQILFSEQLRALDILQAMVNFNLTAIDYEEFLARSADFQVDAWTDESADSEFFKNKKQVAQTLSHAQKFYRLAMDRDAALAQNFINALRQRNLKSGALVIGGFHTAGLLRVLREQNISYEVVRPKMGESDFSKHQGLYEKRMQNQVSVLESAENEAPLVVPPSRVRLQLQSPRRSDAAFFQSLFPVLAGASSVLRGKPVVTDEVLHASAGVLDFEQMDALHAAALKLQSSETWVSEDRATSLFFSPQKGHEALVVASGPAAASLLGKDARILRSSGGHEVSVRRFDFDPRLQARGFTAKAAQRSEMRGDDRLAWIPWSSAKEALMNEEIFKRALELRLEAFVDVPLVFGKGDTKTLSAAGFSLAYKIENGRAQISKIETNWNLNSSETKAALLIFWEEYLGGLALGSKQGVYAAALIERVMKQTLQRLKKQGLLKAFIESQPSELRQGYWQKIMVPYAQAMQQGKTDKQATAAFESALKKQKAAGMNINLPSSSKLVIAWRKDMREAASLAALELARDFPREAAEKNRFLLTEAIPEFLVRYAKLKIFSGQSFESDFADGLMGQARSWAQAFVEMNQKSSSLQQTPAVNGTPKKEAPVIKKLPPKADIKKLPEPVLTVDWFSGLPASPDEFEKYSTEELQGFLEVFEKRRDEHLDEFLSLNRTLLPYYEALVEAIEKKIANLPTEEPQPTVEEPEASSASVQHKNENLFGKFLPWLDASIILLGGAAVYLGLGWSALISAVGMIVAYRVGWIVGVLLNEWGHLLIAGLFFGKTATAFNLKNITANWTIKQPLEALLPGMPLPKGAVWLDPSEPGWIAPIRMMGWLAGAVLVGFLGWYFGLALLALPFFLQAGAIGVLVAQIVAFDSDFIHPPADENCAACGNLGGMAVSQGEETAQFMQTVFRSMGDVLQVRGGQAGGSVVLRQNEKEQIFPSLSRAVNTKRGVLRDQIHAGAARSLKQGKTPAVYFDFRHVRFGTSSAPSEIETHPHQWLPNREARRWTQDARGQWTQKKLILGNFISHNGDFDAYRLNEKMRSNGQVGEWLTHVLGYSNLARGDSPKAAGMMDFLITQGMWDASIRYAYHTVTPDAFEEAMEGRAPAGEQVQLWASRFEEIFQTWQNEKNTDRAVLIKRLNESGIGLSPEIIETATRAFFENDLYRAVQIFSENSEGTFGFLAGSSAYPNKVVMFGDSQPLSLGFDPAKKFLVWTSEPAVLKVPLPDGGRIPYRLDLLQDVGEIFEITLPVSGIPQLRVYDKQRRQELSEEEMRGAYRLIDMQKSKYVSSLPKLDYQNEDLVGKDLKEMAGALDRLREDWLKANSTNRQTASALTQILVEKYIGKMIKDHSGRVLFGPAGGYASEQATLFANLFISNQITEEELLVRIHDAAEEADRLFTEMKKDLKMKMEINRGKGAIEDPVDILITGMATNLWAAEPFAARLNTMFPRMRIATTSSNKILRALKSTGLQTPIRKITVQENSRNITITRNTIVIVADGDMGQDFAPLNATIALRKLIGDRMFVITPEYDTKLGALVQSFHKDAPFEQRIFRTFVGEDSPWRPAEPATLSQQAVDQTFTEILLRLGQEMRELFHQTDPFGMPVSGEDIEQLRRHNREHTHQKMPEITGYDLQGNERKDAAAYQRILKPLSRWSRHVSENVWTWYVTKAFVLISVAFSFPPSAWIGLLPWAMMLGNPVVLLGVHVFDAVLYASSAYLFKFLLRLVQRRSTMHRQGTRSITIADVPKVNQIIKQYLTKLTAQATFLTDFFVDSSNSADHSPYKDPHRVRRGGLIVLGLTEGVLVGLGHAFRSAKLYGSQAQGIQSLPYQEFWDALSGIPVLGRMVRAFGFKLVPPEIVSIGQHPHLESNSAFENVYLGDRIEEVKASTERLVQDLSEIPALRNKTREIQKIVQGEVESLNEFATGEFNKDVAALSDRLIFDLKISEEYRQAVEVAVEHYLRRQVFLTRFVEERFFQPQRIAAMQVGFHHMVSSYSYSKNKIIFKLKQILGIGHRHWETQSHLRVATTASPESGADVTQVAQRMADSTGSKKKVVTQASPDVLPFQVVQSQADFSQNKFERQTALQKALEEEKKKEALRIFARDARARLTQMQEKVLQHEIAQMTELAELVENEKDTLRQLVYRAVLFKYDETQGWIGRNGVPRDLSKRFNEQLSRLKQRAGLGSDFGSQAVVRMLPPEHEFDEIRRRHFQQPRVFAEAVADRVLASRSELRVSSSGAEMLQGLQAQSAMQGSMIVDYELEKMRTLFELPTRDLQERAAAILGSDATDTGLIVLERPYSPKWIAEYLKRVPVGVRVVLRTPEALKPEQRAAYSSELAQAMRKNIFRIEISPALSEDWIRQELGNSFDPSQVIQVGVVEQSSEADDQKLLLSAVMAPGHVLVLGQTRRLQLPGMRWINISDWVDQLYDAVMAIQTSA